MCCSIQLLCLYFVLGCLLQFGHNQANLKKLLVCCLPTQKIRGGSVGSLSFFLIVEVGRSVGFFYFFFFFYIDLCMASTET